MTDSTLHIGTDRQLFVDDHVIQDKTGVRRVLHTPERRNTILQGDRPWDKTSVQFMSIMEDDGIYRGYYRCDHWEPTGTKNPRYTAYAESADGISWEKPSLGLFDFEGSKDNNLVWLRPGANLCAFVDTNPAALPEERYKAVVRLSPAEGEAIGAPGPCVLALSSPDALRWKQMQNGVILTDHPFDSLNVAFWEERESRYVIYTRGVAGVGPFHGGVRWIRRSTSTDFLNWTPLEPIDTGDAPFEHLYTNACVAYARAPGVYLMFPSRYVLDHTPDPDWHGGPGVNDIVFMSSRDGLRFDRSFMEAFLRPGLDVENWHERSLYMETGIVQTSPEELSLYVSDHWRYPTTRISRYVLRTDGFVSMNGGYGGGTLTTKPLVFDGGELEINYSTSAVGSVRVEVQDAEGRAVPGFGLDDCPEIFGDEIDGRVDWGEGADLGSLAGRPVRLKFELKDADVYAFKFG